MSKAIEVQICRVSLLSDMVDEELTRHLEFQRKMTEWEKVEPLDWRTRPYPEVPKSELKDRMKLLRQEMIKLDKML
ncbi:hypothetical protein [Tissierella sp.]|uniref:hypothetical protein n=1 Tax=Tissierella sp. TaxID=41274 RepID=UPI00285D5B87|nr:hypothetical protein [Tissierella sp.]MDR7856051.1 hypothetical protein [Tissierella sp.]